MARSGMSGGGRSSRGGGGRSSGGRSGSSSRGGGFSSPSRSGGGFSSSSRSGGGFSGPPRGGGIPGGFFGGGWNRPRPFGYGGYNYGRPYRRGCSTSIFISIIVFMIVIAVVIGALALANSSGGVTPSTTSRTPLPKSASVETEYFTDELRWIDNPTRLKAGMKSFYDATGVQPHLYITDNLDGNGSPSDDEIDAWMFKTYDDLFRDEAHILVLFLENNNRYISWYMCGVQAKTVIDQEAADILLDYIDRYYYSDMSDSEMFAKAFNDAGKRIMTVTRSPWIPVFMIAGVIAVILILFNIWKARKNQKNLEAEQTKQILNTPIEKIGSEDDPLNDKYDNM